MALGRFLRGLLPGAGSPPPPGVAAQAQGPSGDVAGGVPGRPSGAWRRLPAIQRSVGAAPLVAPNSVFKASLASGRPAPTALAPLGHEVGLKAPAGLVSGVAAPVQRDAGPVPASVRPPTARRLHADGSGAEATPRLADTTTLDSPVWPAFGSSPAEPPEAAAPAPEPSASHVPPAPLRHAPVVETPAPRPAAPLVRASLPAPAPSGKIGGSPSVAREVASAGPSPTAAPAAAAPAPSGGGIPPVRGSSAGGKGGSPPAPGAPASEPLAAREIARPTAGPRRLRVGAPITPVSGRPAVQRQEEPPTAARPAVEPGVPVSLESVASPAFGGSPASGGSPSVRARGPAAGHPSGEPAAPGERAAPGALAPIGAPTVPGGPAVARAPDVTAPVGPADLESHPAAGPAPDAHSEPVPLRPISGEAPAGHAPLVGGLRPRTGTASPAVAVHAQAEHDESSAANDGSPQSALAALARLDPTDEPAHPGVFPGEPSAFFPGIAALPGSAAVVPPTVARSFAAPGATPSAASGFPGRPSPTPVGPRPVLSRTITRGAPPRTPAAARTMTWDPVAGMSVSPDVQAESASLPAGQVTAAPDASTAASVPGSAPSSQGLPPLAPLVAREIDASAPAGAPVQREEAASAGGDGGAAVAGGSMPEAQLDDLARRLHERISARISRDLLIERERVGSLVDRTW